MKSAIAALLLATLSMLPALPGWSEEPTSSDGSHASEDTTDHAEPNRGFRLGRQASWIFGSFLEDESGDNLTLGLEFESTFGLGGYEVKNISYFEVAHYARGVPGQPAGTPEPSIEAADGITDLLTAFWFSKKGAHHGKHHFSLGFAAQFPTASDDTLGSGKYSLGPSFDYEF